MNTYPRKKDGHLVGRSLLESMAMGLACPILIIPAMVILLNASDLGLWWLPLLLAYLTLFFVPAGYLWKQREKSRFHFLAGDELYYRTYPRDLQRALRAARTEGIPPEVAETLALYGDTARGGAVPAGKSAQKQARERQFALDLYELGVIDRAELLYRLKSK